MSLYTTDSARPLGGGLQSPAGSLTESELASRCAGSHTHTQARAPT